MMMPTSVDSSYGISQTAFDGTHPTYRLPHTDHEPTGAPTPEFGQIVALYQTNELLLSELEKVKKSQDRARAYLETPGSNPALAEAHLLRTKARHSAVLTMLRANRIQARSLVGQSWSACDSISA
jgi:hypothetical protein